MTRTGTIGACYEMTTPQAPMTHPHTATMHYLQDTVQLIQQANDRLYAQDGYHLDHARELCRRAMDYLALVDRRLTRAQETRDHARLST